jgi:hypothetical protein
MPPTAGGPGSTPTPPTSSPNTTPTPGTSASYLHVLQRPWVMSYPIDPTGRLLPPVTQRVANDLVALSGEPQGRFVLAARDERFAAAFVSYAPDPRDGTLVKRSEAGTAPCGGFQCIESTVWIRAGANRVHGMWRGVFGTSQNEWFSYVSANLGSDGQLGDVTRSQFQIYSDPGLAVVDVRENVLYKTEERYTAHGALEGHVIEPDGSLTRIETTHLCLAHRFCDGCAYPVVTARGFLIAAARPDSFTESTSVCTYQGLRLKPIGALDFGATRAEAYVSESEQQPVLVAMNTETPTAGARHEELRLFALVDDGGLQALDVKDLLKPSRQILFHSSGRAL